MTKNKIGRKDYAYLLLTIGGLALAIAFIVGMILSMIGGSWEMMQQSEKIMIAWQINLAGAIIGLFNTIIGIIMYNIP